MSDVRYYVLFANYEQGLKLHGILDGAGVQNRIAPAPRCIQGEACRCSSKRSTSTKPEKP